MHAQMSGNFQYNTRTNLLGFQIEKPALTDSNITINVTGLMNTMAANYVAVFNIMQVGETISSTQEMMTARINTFIDELKKRGIEEKNIKTDMISFVPKYDYQTENKLFSKTYNEVPAGFELQKNIYVQYKDSQKTDDIVAAAAASEIYDLVKVDYFLDDSQKLIDSLKSRCIDVLKNKIKHYEQLGFKLDTYKKTVGDDFYISYPPERYDSYTAFSRPALQAVKKKASATVNETDKSVSKYFKSVDNNYFDLIINPVISEPPVQIIYAISIKYTPKDDEKNTPNYYIITPSGDVKQLQVK